MAAVLALRLAARRLGLRAPPRRTLSGSLRKDGKEGEAEKTVAEEKCEPSVVCPPPRSRSYQPPGDVQNFIHSLVKEVFGPSLPENWQQTPLDDMRLKFRLLAHLAAELGHTVPNSQLHLMRSAGDVLDFYSTPVKDASKFDELCAAKLPPNLKIIWEQ
ncbi:39S ribosomal protein L50, mitochondrial isoform X2 [Apus apus]|uniref:39S ribosomal protein L50, mitochondrial isoform X2 n=1 Tax=Apus apus TaxID=8895 RepID=UPI0021F8AC94|nr:39S ribosomal protein L50, mitochondrial isoform X2 [Apus apus]